jgi:hypothetical protein
MIGDMGLAAIGDDDLEAIAGWSRRSRAQRSRPVRAEDARRGGVQMRHDADAVREALRGRVGDVLERSPQRVCSPSDVTQQC